MNEKKENTSEDLTKVKGLGSIWWFATFCTLFIAGILYSLGYRVVAGIAAPMIFLAITIPVLSKDKEFKKADKDEMFNFEYGKICARMIDSAGLYLFALAISLRLFPEIPAYLALAFVGALFYGYVFFRYYRWLKRGSEK